MKPRLEEKYASMLTDENLLYEGKAKKIFKSPDPGEVIIEYKDQATAFDGKKKETITEKGGLNNRISNILFQKLNEKGIATHYIKELDEIHSVVRHVTIFPIEVVVRNYIAGSLKRRTGMQEGLQLRQPIVEWYYKSDELNDPMINVDHILCFEWATQEEIHHLHTEALKINQALLELFDSIELLLVDFKLEFGSVPDSIQTDTRIVLADEISPDTCRLWDKTTHQKMDKDVFRFDLGDLKTTYEQIYERVKRL